MADILKSAANCDSKTSNPWFAIDFFLISVMIYSSPIKTTVHRCRATVLGRYLEEVLDVNAVANGVLKVIFANKNLLPVKVLHICERG